MFWQQQAHIQVTRHSWSLSSADVKGLLYNLCCSRRVVEHILRNFVTTALLTLILCFHYSELPSPHPELSPELPDSSLLRALPPRCLLEPGRLTSSVFLFQMHLLSVLRPLGEQVGELIPIKVECQIALTYYIYSPPSNLHIFRALHGSGGISIISWGSLCVPQACI